MRLLNFFLSFVILVLGTVLLAQATGLNPRFWEYFAKEPEIVIHQDPEQETTPPPNLTFQQYLDKGDELEAQGLLELAVANFAKAHSLEPSSPLPELRIATAYFAA